mmetsp:Transcript_17747/g.34570  ORF Transcript_17747/g.34570 Transcript_17747/m.34570 type:complete len:276 (+) Transcript_17747:86-913(+)
MDTQSYSTTITVAGAYAASINPAHTDYWVPPIVGSSGTVAAEADEALSLRRAERSHTRRTVFLLSDRSNLNSGFSSDSRPTGDLDTCEAAALLASNDRRPRFPSQGQSDTRVFPSSRRLPPNPPAGEAVRDVRVFPKSRHLPFGLLMEPLASMSMLAARGPTLLLPSAPASAAREANLEIAPFGRPGAPRRRTPGAPPSLACGAGAVLVAPPPPSSGSSSMDESSDVTQSLSPGFSLQSRRPRFALTAVGMAPTATRSMRPFSLPSKTSSTSSRW